jgi:hypothetical protein
VFPDREIVDLRRRIRSSAASTRSTAIRRSRARVVLQRAARGRRAATSPKLRAIEDDDGRAMVLINWNTDMGDGWEWSNAADYPGYVKFTAQAYRMMINEIVYSLTH